MGFSTYKPEWQVTTPVEFKSDNPLITDKVCLETYHITVPDFDAKGKQIGEHDELCVTHSSLLHWYEKNLMPKGCTMQCEPYPGVKNGIIVKCSLKMGNIHVEALGEASGDNCSTEISFKHPTNTAENRAFDRALIRYLALNLDEFNGIDQIYSSSDEIGQPKRESSEPATAPSPSAPTPRPAADSSTPTWFNATAPVPAPVSSAPAVSTAEKIGEMTVHTAVPTAPAAEAAPAENPKPAKQDPVDEYREERLAASKLEFTAQEYEGMLNSPFYGLSNCEFNGKLFRDMIDLLKAKNVAAGKALQMFVKFRPFQTEKIPNWKCLISYLNKEQLIRFYPTGNFFVGVK